jgi:hypothetical protein
MKKIYLVLIAAVILLTAVPLLAQITTPETPEEAWGAGVVVVLNALLPVLILKITSAVSGKTTRFLIAAGFSLLSVVFYFMISKVPINAGNIVETFTLAFAVAQIGWRTWFNKFTNT